MRGVMTRIACGSSVRVRRGDVVLSCGVGNHVGTPGLPGGAEGIRTDGHRGRGEISSWIAAWGFARPLKAALGGGLPFRLAASRYRGRGKDLRRHRSLRSRRRKEPKASAKNTGIPRRRHPEELPIDPLENTIRRLRSSAGMRKYRPFLCSQAMAQLDPNEQISVRRKAERAERLAASYRRLRTRSHGPTPGSLTAPAPWRSQASPASAKSLRARARGQRVLRRDGRLNDRAWQAQAMRAARRFGHPGVSR
jgi:hypothetical protein